MISSKPSHVSETSIQMLFVLGIGSDLQGEVEFNSEHTPGVKEAVS